MNFGNKLGENIFASFLVNVLSFIILWLLLLLVEICVHLIKYVFDINLLEPHSLFCSLWFNTNNKIAQSVKGIRCNILCIAFAIIYLSSFWPTTPAILWSWLYNLSWRLSYIQLTLPLCFVLICVKRAG
jgi:hypothetical protein